MATEKKVIEARLAVLERELKERGKELNCIYGIGALLEQPGITLEELIQGIVDLMPGRLAVPRDRLRTCHPGGSGVQDGELQRNPLEASQRHCVAWRADRLSGVLLSGGKARK